jgi:hypothetical protein
VSYGVLVQPDGRLAVWSSRVDALIAWDATDEEVVELFIEDAVRRQRQATAWTIARTRKGLGPRSLPSYDEAVEATRRKFPESAP